MKNKKLLYAIGGAAAFVLLILIVASSGGPSPQQQAPAESEAPPAAGFETFSGLAGEYQGTWTNSTFGTKGSVEARLALPQDGTATFSVDVGGLVFGLVDPEPKTFSGVYNVQEVYFSANDELFGNFVVSIKPSGELTMQAPNVSAPGIDRFEVNGVFANGAINARYVIFMKGGTRAEGSVQLTAR